MNKVVFSTIMLLNLILGIPLALAQGTGQVEAGTDTVSPGMQVIAGQKFIDAAENVKNMEKYSNKEVFLISDQNWKDVLTFLPVAVWTDSSGTINIYPYLIFHVEGSNFDADSIIHFLKQYGVEKITMVSDYPQSLIGLLKTELGLQDNQINYIDVSKYRSYWRNFENIVYVEDNYDSALLASTYASLNNIPLIIQNSPLDLPSTFKESNVILVGSVDCPSSEATCDAPYTKEELKLKYIEETGTDKIILINPNDLDISVDEDFVTEKSGSTISNLYTKTSLGAPILASAKHEIIVSTNLTNYTDVDLFVKEQIGRIQGIRYLTIFASPDAIQMTYEGPGLRFVTDKVYATNHDGFQTLAVGRIFGITISDVSSYVARSVFYQEMPRSNIFAVLFPTGELLSPEVGYGAYALDKLLSSMGFIDESVLENLSLMEDFDYTNKFYIDFFGHGSPHGWSHALSTFQMREENIWLQSPLIYGGEACLGCAYDKIKAKGDLFCSNVIRRGALAYVGNINVSGEGGNSKNFLERLIIGRDIGNALKEAHNLQFVFWANSNTVEQLVGDPTIDLEFRNPQIDSMIVNDTVDKERVIQISAKRDSNISAYFGSYVAYSYPPIYIYDFSSNSSLSFNRIVLTQDGETEEVQTSTCKYNQPQYPNIEILTPTEDCKRNIEFLNIDASLSIWIVKYFDKHYLVIHDRFSTLSNNHKIRIAFNQLPAHAKPDFIVKDIKVFPEWPTVDDDVYFKVKIMNLGLRPSTTGSQTKFVCTVDDETSAGWNYLNANNLGSRETSGWLDCAFGPRKYSQGTHSVKVTVDVENVVVEEEEDNNLRTKRFNVHQLPCAEEGERVNRNPFLGDTSQQCCPGLYEDRVSRSYSICRKSEGSECEEQGGVCMPSFQDCKPGYREMSLACGGEQQKCCFAENIALEEGGSITVTPQEIVLERKRIVTGEPEVIKKVEVGKPEAPGEPSEIMVRQEAGLTYLSDKEKTVRFETPQKKEVIIRPGQEKTILESGGAKIMTKLTLQLENQRLQAKAGQAEKAIKIMPDEVQTKVKELKIEKPTMELKELKPGKISYQIQGLKKQRLFGFIPVNVKHTIEINPENGQIEKVKKPWWSFLAF